MTQTPPPYPEPLPPGPPPSGRVGYTPAPMMPTIPSAPPTPWGPWATVGLTAASMAIGLIISIPVAVVGFAADMAIRGTMMPDDSAAMLALGMGIVAVSQVVTLGAVIFFAWLRKPIPVRRYFALHRFGGKALGLAAVALVAWLGFEAAVNLLLQQPVPESMVELMAHPAVLPLVWVVVVLVAPVCEEAVFRGFMWRGLIDSRLGLHGTVLVTCLPWTLLHLGQYGLINMILLFLGGCLFGYARHLSGSLWVPMLMHFVMNLFAMVVMTVYMATGQL